MTETLQIMSLSLGYHVTSMKWTWAHRQTTEKEIGIIEWYLDLGSLLRHTWQNFLIGSYNLRISYIRVNNKT